MDYRQAIDNLLRAAMVVSPTEVEQEKFTDLVSDLRSKGLSDKRVAQQLLQAMLDGLRFDNWDSFSLQGN